MAVTVLSGTSGALYYKPAGTTGTFGTAEVDTTDDEMTVQPYLNLKVGDLVKFSVVNSSTGAAGTGTLPAGLTAGTTYYVITYTASTGILKVSATAGGAAVNLTDVGTAAAPNEFQVAYADFAAVGKVRSWSFEISRAEIDVTTIGQTPGQYAPFREYIAGFADGNGTAEIYITNEDAALGNRMVEDVLQRQQVGAAFKLYVDRVETGGSVSATLSRSLSFDASLISATMNVNPDDAQMVEIGFRPSGNFAFDWSTSS
jgi:hypothetical protein